MFPDTDRTDSEAGSHQPRSPHAHFLSVHRDLKHVRDGRFYRADWTPYTSDSMTSVADTLKRWVWSACQWQGTERLQNKFGRGNLLVLDYDDGATLANAMNRFSDCAYVIGTTKSHQISKRGVKCDRFRVVMKLSESIEDLATWRATMAHYVNKFDSDPQCIDGARFYWPCEAIIRVQEDGESWDKILPSVSKARIAPKRFAQHGVVRTRTRIALARPFALSTYNSSCFNVAKDLTDAGYGANEIFDFITLSPTYQGKPLERSTADEIWDCIRNGIKSVKEGTAYGRRDGHRDGKAEEKARGPKPPK